MHDRHQISVFHYLIFRASRRPCIAGAAINRSDKASITNLITKHRMSVTKTVLTLGLPRRELVPISNDVISHRCSRAFCLLSFFFLLFSSQLWTSVREIKFIKISQRRIVDWRCTTTPYIVASRRRTVVAMTQWSWTVQQIIIIMLIIII